MKEFCYYNFPVQNVNLNHVVEFVISDDQYIELDDKNKEKCTKCIITEEEYNLLKEYNLFSEINLNNNNQVSIRTKWPVSDDEYYNNIESMSSRFKQNNRRRFRQSRNYKIQKENNEKVIKNISNDDKWTSNNKNNDYTLSILQSEYLKLKNKNTDDSILQKIIELKDKIINRESNVDMKTEYINKYKLLLLHQDKDYVSMIHIYDELLKNIKRAKDSYAISKIVSNYEANDLNKIRKEALQMVKDAFLNGDLNGLKDIKNTIES